MSQSHDWHEPSHNPDISAEPHQTFLDFGNSSSNSIPRPLSYKQTTKEPHQTFLDFGNSSSNSIPRPLSYTQTTK